ncbi:hypothetical protein LPJ59_005962 [Coemansia sp. RSA 2399]|nr:hypothetical protein LPJ59_005962 [Coemansia sp. RSA 2399]KAJ1890775.1 hypothetical protein LPJ81_005875 [Coemansia sp. IMI 209127]
MKVFFAGILALTIAAVAVSAAPAGDAFDSADFSSGESHHPHSWDHDMSGHELPSDFSDCSDFSDWDGEDASDEDGHSHSGGHRRHHRCHHPMSGEHPSGDAPEIPTSSSY